jgi:hypothetical protein
MKQNITRKNRSLRIARIDLFKLTRGLYDEGYKGIRWLVTKKNIFGCWTGNENKTTDDDDRPILQGSKKVGFDYNAYENWLENIISIGLYGFSTFNQELNSYKIYNANPYFERPPVASGAKWLNCQLIEVVAGLKAKVFDNVFIGFSLRLNRLVSNKNRKFWQPLYSWF